MIGSFRILAIWTMKPPILSPGEDSGDDPETYLLSVGRMVRQKRLRAAGGQVSRPDHKLRYCNDKFTNGNDCFPRASSPGMGLSGAAAPGGRRAGAAAGAWASGLGNGRRGRADHAGSTTTAG